jgi:hypothetical protein
MFSYFDNICYVGVLMLNKNKKNAAKLKNQNGNLIQDGAESIFYCSHNKPPFLFFGLATKVLFYLL